MRIYFRNNPVEFHPDPIWNDGTMTFSKRSPNQNNKKNKNKTSSDISDQFLI